MRDARAGDVTGARARVAAARLSPGRRRAVRQSRRGRRWRRPQRAAGRHPDTGAHISRRSSRAGCRTAPGSSSRAAAARRWWRCWRSSTAATSPTSADRRACPRSRTRCSTRARHREPRSQIAADAERLGAKLNAYARLETNNVRLSALKSNLAPSLSLMADVIRNPTFTQADIDRVRRIWLADIAQEQAEPVGLALRLLPPAIYGADSAYGSPLTGSGSPDSIAALTREDLARFHRERIRPDNATFFVVGDVTLADATAALETAFRGWSAPAEAIPAIAPAIAPAAQGAAPHPRRSSRLAAVADPCGARDDAGRGADGARAGSDERRVRRPLLGARQHEPARSQGLVVWGLHLFPERSRTAAVADLCARADRQDQGQPRRAATRARPRSAVPVRSPPRSSSGARLQSIRALPGSFETTANVLDALAGAAASGRPLDWTATLAESLSRHDAGGCAGGGRRDRPCRRSGVGGGRRPRGDRSGPAQPRSRADRDLGRQRPAGRRCRGDPVARIGADASCYSAAEASNSRRTDRTRVERERRRRRRHLAETAPPQGGAVGARLRRRGLGGTAGLRVRQRGVRLARTSSARSRSSPSWSACRSCS